MINASDIRDRLLGQLALPTLPVEIGTLIDQLIDECLKNHELISDVKAFDHDELSQMAEVNDPVLKKLEGCRRVFLGLVSLGPASQAYLETLKDKGSFESYCSNEIYDIILSDFFSDTLDKLKHSLDADSELDRPIIPGEEDASLEWQKVIFRCLHPGVILDEQTLIMTPVKSFSFILGERRKEETPCRKNLSPFNDSIDHHKHLIHIIINDAVYAVADHARLYDVLVDNRIDFDGYCGGNHRCGKCLITIMNEHQPETKLACETYCTEGMKVLTQGERHRMKIEENYQGIRHERLGGSCEDGFGLVFDVGTTTVVGGCYDMGSKKQINVITEPNDQFRYGLDVISRIGYSIYNEKGLERLNQAIIGQLNVMISRLIDDLKMKVTRIIIVGNPTMISIINNIPLDSLGGYPFESKVSHTIRLKATEIGLASEAEVVCISGVSGFIGSDVLSGIVACKFYEADRYQLLIDLGTNGEIALGNRKHIWACSTAAGPAFEGAKISCGVPSIPGAVYKFAMEKEHLDYVTIDNLPPIGFCGSGIIDLICELLKNGLIDKSGMFMKNDSFRMTIGKTDFTFNQQDVREMQLAKSAVISGIEILLKKANINKGDLENVYISGGFGSNINVKNTAFIGLLPEGIEGKVKLIGNSAFYGASLYLLFEDYQDLFSQTKTTVTSLDLNDEECFTDLFINNLEFKNH